jgi:hypothetical protein
MYAKITAIPVLTLALSTSCNGAIPERLSAALAAHGCVDIAEDAEVLQNRQHWWVSLEPFTRGDGDFAFYCQDVADALSFRLVVVVKSGNNPWRGCDPVVDSWRELSAPWFPYDLAVVTAAPRYLRNTDLGRWWLVSSSNNPEVTYGPPGVKVSDPIIDTTGGSAGTLYGCYANSWYRIGLD